MKIQIKFTRGSGLGNRLFPWARACIYSLKHNLIIPKPRWFHFRKASFISGGIDYSKFFRKILLFDNFKFNFIPSLSRKKDAIIFEGDGNFFEDLYGHEDFIFQSLLSITKKKYLKYNDSHQFSIVLNVRLGKDFQKATTKDDFINKGGILSPIEWYKKTLICLRAAIGSNLSACIISDGTKEQVKELLLEPNISFIETPAAITDLLVLSKAKYIIGTGGSSFTAWGCFLSKARTITIYGQSLAWFKLNKPELGYFITTFDPDLENYETLKESLNI